MTHRPSDKEVIIIERACRLLKRSRSLLRTSEAQVQAAIELRAFLQCIGTSQVEGQATDESPRSETTE